MAQYENKVDRLNILLADELPEDMTGQQDTQRICGKCAWYSFAKLESICRKTGREVAFFANRECFTTEKDTTMEENTNAQPVAETGTQVCKECGRTLPLEDFQRRRYGKRDKVCKVCRAEKIRVGIATGKEKAVKVENPGLVVTSEEVANAKRVEIAQLSRYLTDFKMAGLALWGMLPGKEEDIDQIIKAEWAVPFCREIFAAAAELKRDGANVVPAIVSRRLGSIGRTFVEELGEAFYELAQECDTSEQTIKEEKTSVKDVLTKAGIKPYKDGNQWCILAGDNLQEGICGFGDTIEDALCEFLTDVFKSQNEQKSAEWSEEDDWKRKELIQYLEEKGDYRTVWMTWLKSLPERFNLQPKQEWSEVELEFRGEKVKIKRPFFRDDKGRGYSTTEQDEEVAWNALRAWCEKKGVSLYDLYPKEEWSDEDTEMYINVASSLRGYACGLENEEHKRHIKKELDWLEYRFQSLRPSWKPTEEQKEALEYVIRDYREDGCNATANYLQEILDHLKNM